MLQTVPCKFTIDVGTFGFYMPNPYANEYSHFLAIRLKGCILKAVSVSLRRFGVLVVIGIALGTYADVSTPWRLHTIDNTLNGADGVKLLDVDGDGKLDIAAAWEESGKSRLYLNPGTHNALYLPWSYIDAGPAQGAEDAALADVDGDGRTDVISSGTGSPNGLKDNPGMTIHFAPTTGDYRDAKAWTTVSFPESVVGSFRWMYSIAVDVNQDGHVDIVSGGRYLQRNRPATIGWFQAPPQEKRDLSRWHFHHMNAAGWVMSLVAQDMDGDGDVDIVASDRKVGNAIDLRGVRWLENPGNPELQKNPWKNHVIGAEHQEVMFISMADLDSDGDLDTVVPHTSPNGIAWYERLSHSGSSWREHRIDYRSSLGTPKAISVADVNCDGQLDLILTCESASAPKSAIVWLDYGNQNPTNVVWTINDISGPIPLGRKSRFRRLLGMPENASAGIKFDRIEVSDLDSDGDLDIITTEENHGRRSRGLGVVWFENPQIRLNEGD